MKLYGVYLGIDNGVENWAVHALIGGKEGFFIESSPALMTKEQTERIVTRLKEIPEFASKLGALKIPELLDTEA